ncbi:DNA -binding domain-containing protein [Sphingomonas adhaesiva]|uniref:DNA -binding domain-containing protein n=1 Tax=Sphingomonas adhaesiva TaxID=28212 RepID=UPI002FF69B38
MGQATPRLLDDPPVGDQLTDYDREHMVLYLRLLDAARDGADWREAVQVLFGLDPTAEPQRCRHMHDTHLARARWMTEQGYRHLVREGQRAS